VEFRDNGAAELHKIAGGMGADLDAERSQAVCPVMIAGGVDVCPGDDRGVR
jgi:hypothetical protein